MAVTEADNVPFLRHEEIEEKAAAVLRDHNLVTIPINPVELANRLGISVYNAKFSDESIVGMIARKNGATTLLVKQSDPPARKRFTVAHELAHHFLHLHEDGDFVDGEANLFRQFPGDEKEMSPDRRREIQANMFASALLMPEEAVRTEWKQDPSIERLARLFNVSVEAMGYRVAALGLE